MRAMKKYRSKKQFKKELAEVLEFYHKQQNQVKKQKQKKKVKK